MVATPADAGRPVPSFVLRDEDIVFRRRRTWARATDHTDCLTDVAVARRAWIRTTRAARPWSAAAAAATVVPKGDAAAAAAPVIPVALDHGFEGAGKVACRDLKGLEARNSKSKTKSKIVQYGDKYPWTYKVNSSHEYAS